MRTTIEYAGIELEVHYDYQPPEAPNYDINSPLCGPGSPAYVDIYEIRHQGEEITDLIEEFTRNELEQQVLEMMGAEAYA